METTLTIKLKIEQVISILQQLDIKDRISVLKEFSDEWIMLLNKIRPEPMTIEEYNKKLEQGILDFQNGNYLNHQEMKAEIEQWKEKRR